MDLLRGPESRAGILDSPVTSDSQASSQYASRFSMCKVRQVNLELDNHSGDSNTDQISKPLNGKSSILRRAFSLAELRHPPRLTIRRLLNMPFGARDDLFYALQEYKRTMAIGALKLQTHRPHRSVTPPRINAIFFAVFQHSMSLTLQLCMIPLLALISGVIALIVRAKRLSLKFLQGPQSPSLLVGEFFTCW